MSRRLFPLLLAATFAAALVGCSPKLSPLYRDYAVPEADTTAAAEASAEVAPAIGVQNTPASTDPETLAKIRRALEADGWTLDEDDGVALVTTEPRRISEWGLYHVAASLEVVPLGQDYVRVLVHPFRVYITGGRTKIPFLQKRMRRVVMPSVTDALAAEGLAPAGTAKERDEDAVD